jgi:hypothetical protein
MNINGKGRLEEQELVLCLWEEEEEEEKRNRKNGNTVFARREFETIAKIFFFFLE